MQVSETAARLVEGHEVREGAHHRLQGHGFLFRALALDAKPQVRGLAGVEHGRKHEFEIMAQLLPGRVAGVDDTGHDAGHREIRRGVESALGGRGCEVGKHAVFARTAGCEREFPFPGLATRLGMQVLVIGQRRINHQQVELARVGDEEVGRTEGFTVRRAQGERERDRLVALGRTVALQRHDHRRPRRHDGNELRIGRIAELDRPLPFQPEIHVIHVGTGRQQADPHVEHHRHGGDENDLAVAVHAFFSLFTKSSICQLLPSAR